ncbi:MAG TPA: membrane protein insertase YidC [Bryobacteraceae bacterium]|jgi:YidC/Oxa1 family membrane protein insertase|nr:membrane protein insertase YidC [Bryobacteraceae bacterium]
MSSTSSNNSPSDKEPKELSNEVRMVIAFVLMGLILVVTPWAYKQLGITPPQSDQKKAATANPGETTRGEKAADEKAVSGKSAKDAAAKAATSTASGTPMALQTAPAEAPSADAVSAAAAQEYTLDTDLYRVVFSNRGATVKSWTLKKFNDSAGKPLELVNQKGAEKVGYPFSFNFRDKQPSSDLNKVLWVGRQSPNTMTFEYSDGRTHAVKTIALQQGGYMVQYSDEVTQNGMGLPHLVQWRGGFGDMAVQNAAGQQATIHYDLEKNKLIRDAAKTAKNGPVNADGMYSFAGIDDAYFAAAFLPPPNTGLSTTTFQDTVASPINSAEDPYPGVAVGGAARNQFGIYLGPKEISALHLVNPKLDGIVDWGWFGIVAKPLFIVLHYLNDKFTHNYGWAIVLITIIINMALFPLKITQLKSSRKMQALQPEMTKLNEKYKGISMSDPRAANKQQEMMDLYKKHGVNPVGGCIPLVIQMPFIYAFYKVLAVSIELRHASWLWVGDLSQHEHFEIHFLPLIMVVTSYALQKMTPPPAAGDATQQKMMQFMPLMYLFFFWSLSSGVVLYWLTGNITGVAQQWFFNKTAGPVEARAVATKPRKGR